MRRKKRAEAVAKEMYQIHWEMEARERRRRRYIDEFMEAYQQRVREELEVLRTKGFW